MTSAAERIGKNEAVFRAVNERIVEVGSGFLQIAGDEPLDFVCECSRSGCVASVSMTIAEYELIRAEPTRFFVVRGHENLEVERIVADGDGYTIVEKLGEAGRVASEEDPRS